jgi:phage tail sheath protein FI
MPVTPKYPGVYIEDVSAGVQLIEGVDTSIAAFIGAAARGQVNNPVEVTSFSEFEKCFGGLFAQGQMSYAVRDFFTNGGRRALIVRLVSTDAAPADIPLTGFPSRSLLAANQGAWGNSLHAVVDNNVDSNVAASLGLTTADLFNLSVFDSLANVIEVHPNLTIKDTPRRIDRVLAAESTLVGIAPEAVLTIVPNANPFPLAGASPWADPNANTVATPASGSDGSSLLESDFIGEGREESRSGLYAVLRADLFNLLCIPPYTPSGDVDPAVIARAAELCENRRAFHLIDPPISWTNADSAEIGLASLGTTSSHAAVFFPRIMEPDPLQSDTLAAFAPCGAVAGVIARIDSQRGVWKAPAGVTAQLEGVSSLQFMITNSDNSRLNSLGVNCLRNMPAVGNAVWGSRTLQGGDALGSEWKYIPVRRLANYIEESLYRGLQWAVFEANGEPLWAELRLAVSVFMSGLFRDGALQGVQAQQAFFVKCDTSTTSQGDIDQGFVNILVGFAPIKPAEFIILQIRQAAGQPPD